MDAMEESLGKEEYTSGVGSSRPRVLNAFDLINQTGGFALDKLFSPVIDIGKSNKSKRFRGLFLYLLYTGGVLFRVKWCIR